MLKQLHIPIDPNIPDLHPHQYLAYHLFLIASHYTCNRQTLAGDADSYHKTSGGPTTFIPQASCI